MPRSLSTALQAQVSSTATKTAFLVELNLSSTIRLTDWYSNVNYDSNSYEAGGSFLSVDATTETGQLQVNEINLGFSNITEKIVVHQSRKYGVTKFGLERFINGFLDLLTITFVSRFGKKPMHFFGVLGMFIFIFGFGLFAYIGGNKLYAMFSGIVAKNIADMSGFYIALTSMIIGVQLFLAGFIAEMVSRNSYDRSNYQIEKEI